jgi:uncharacterized protein YerC
MTNVSKRKLKPKDKAALEQQLAAVFAKLDDSAARSFLDSMLTDAERTMYMKRLAAVLMLHRGYSPYRVWTALQLSPSTAERYALQYSIGKYDQFLSQLDQKATTKKHRELLAVIANLLDNIIAPMGRDRWRYLRGLPN